MKLYSVDILVQRNYESIVKLNFWKFGDLRMFSLIILESYNFRALSPIFSK